MAIVRQKSMIWTLGCLGCSGTTLMGVFILAVTTVVMIMSNGGSGLLQACSPNDTAGGTDVVPAKVKEGSIPRNYAELYKAVGKKWNIPMKVLAGIGYVETHHGQFQGAGVSSGENYAGAGGPMQFLESSWEAYGADFALDRDGDGKPDRDGKRNRYDPADAIAGAANHLRGSIGKNSEEDKKKRLSQHEIVRAIHRYNPGNYTPYSNPYVKKVLAAANRYEKEYDLGPANYAGTSACSVPSTLGSGSFGQRIANAAAKWATAERGKPQPPPDRKNKPAHYSWGGGTPEGPSYGIRHGAGTLGFDCSALALYAVYQASNKKITLPRTTYAMWDSDKGVKVSRDQLAPGDLVFFNTRFGRLAHMAIYYGEVNGVRWIVEALKTGTDVHFAKFDAKSGYEGALRVIPPPGMESKSPDTIRALESAGAGTGAGAM